MKYIQNEKDKDYARASRRTETIKIKETDCYVLANLENPSVGLEMIPSRSDLYCMAIEEVQEHRITAVHAAVKGNKLI